MANSNKTFNVIRQVVDKDLCSGCGVCATCCPNSLLAMGLNIKGDLTSRWASKSCSTPCGICLKACPFSSGIHDPRTSYPSFQECSGATFDENIGWFYKTYSGYSHEHRASSASGGLLTYTLEHLLISGSIDRVAAVSWDNRTNDGTFAFRVCRSVDEIRQSSGSFYYQVSVTDVLQEIRAKSSLRWAVTGVPCLCTALRNAIELSPELQKTIRYILGLACGMYQNRFYTEFLAMESGVPLEKTSSVCYRTKSTTGSPSNYIFVAKDQKGRTGRRIEYLDTPYLLGSNGFFRCNACNFCKDVYAENADACYMDAWLNEYINEPRGTNLVVVRNQEISTLLKNGNVSGDVKFDEIPSVKIVESQAFHVERKLHSIKIRMGIQQDNIGKKTYILKTIDWKIQKYIQNQSKNRWRIFGKRFGINVFWKMSRDLQLLIKIRSKLKKYYEVK